MVGVGIGMIADGTLGRCLFIFFGFFWIDFDRWIWCFCCRETKRILRVLRVRDICPSINQGPTRTTRITGSPAPDPVAPPSRGPSQAVPGRAAGTPLLRRRLFHPPPCLPIGGKLGFFFFRSIRV